jgi:hypothetical protein
MLQKVLIKLFTIIIIKNLEYSDVEAIVNDLERRHSTEIISVTGDVTAPATLKFHGINLLKRALIIL